MAGGVKFVMQLRYFDADGNPKVLEGEDANRVLSFSSDYIGTKDNVSSPKRFAITPRISPTAEAADLDALTARVTAAENDIITLASSLASALSAITILAGRVTTLEAERWTETSIKTLNYTAASWEHVLVDLGGLLVDVTIAMPASPAEGDRVRVTEISTDGGYGNGRTLHVSGAFITAEGGGYWAPSPHPVAYSAGDGGSLKGASIELVYVGAGWVVVSETAQVERLL